MKTSKVATFVIAFGVVSVSGCIEIKPLIQHEEISYKPGIPIGKTVAVVPFNNYMNQIEAARSLEMVLVDYGFNVTSYQIESKEVEKRTGSGIAGAQLEGNAAGANAVGAESRESTVEKYISYETTKFDYAFQILLSEYDGVVKVVSVKENNAVLAVCSFNESMLKEDITECLVKRKLIIAETP